MKFLIPIFILAHAYFAYSEPLWPEDQFLPQYAFRFFNKNTEIPFSYAHDGTEIWVRFVRRGLICEMPLHDDFLTSIDYAGNIVDKDGQYIPDDVMFEQDGTFKGYDARLPVHTRAVQRTFDGRWLTKLYKRGHAFCRKLPR